VNSQPFHALNPSAVEVGVMAATWFFFSFIDHFGIITATP
jgi:hypothetical protein